MSDRDGRLSDLFDGLATRVRSAELRTVGFTGAFSGEGASTLALGTSLSLAALDAGPVLLVDANWLRPSLTSDAGLGSRRGLADVLGRDADLGQIVLPTGRPRLAFLAAGSLDGERPRPGALSAFLDRALSEYSAVVIDLPSVVAGDALVLSWATALRRIFVVVQSGVTPVAVVRRAVQIVALARPQVVLNRAPLATAGWTALLPVAVT